MINRLVYRCYPNKYGGLGTEHRASVSAIAFFSSLWPWWARKVTHICTQCRLWGLALHVSSPRERTHEYKRQTVFYQCWLVDQRSWSTPALIKNGPPTSYKKIQEGHCACGFSCRKIDYPSWVGDEMQLPKHQLVYPSLHNRACWTVLGLGAVAYEFQRVFESHGLVDLGGDTLGENRPDVGPHYSSFSLEPLSLINCWRRQ